MNGLIVILVLALACGASAQVLVDNFDPRVPRPGATLPASIDPYGWSRPLPPSIDPLGVSYRPAHAGAVLPALFDPLGASRPGGLPFALDPNGYTRTNGAYGGYNGYERNGGYGGYGGYGFGRVGSNFAGGTYGGVVDPFLARPAGFITGVGTNPIFPDPNLGAPLVAARVPGTFPPPPTVTVPVMPVSAVPVAPVAPVAPAVTYPVNPVSVPVNPVQVPSYNPAPALPPINLSIGTGGVPNFPIGGSAFPGTSALPVPSGGVPGLPNFPNLPNLPTNVPVNAGNLQLGGGARPVNGGNAAADGTTTSVVPNGNFLPPV